MQLNVEGLTVLNGDELYWPLNHLYLNIKMIVKLHFSIDINGNRLINWLRQKRLTYHKTNQKTEQVTNCNFLAFEYYIFIDWSIAW